MNRIILGVCAALTPSLCFGPAAASSSAGQRNFASETRSIFAAKCAGCHGAALAKPKGRFGYVLDLARLAANPEMVIPSFPDESELWELVHRGEMPPEDSPTGPLSDAEKEVIRSWIGGGAPANSLSPADLNPPETNIGTPTSSVEKDILHGLGPFHLVVVHFPIALLIAAAVAELWSAQHGIRIPTPEVRFCVLLGAASAVLAAALGWVHAGNGHGAGALHVLRIHRWIGTTAAAWAVGTAFISEWEERRGARSQWFRGWLLVGAILVAVEGHFGGMLVHGDNFLSGG
jgi:uncharacterized membrane protein/mono/diheme cytochrome c family protein